MYMIVFVVGFIVGGCVTVACMYKPAKRYFEELEGEMRALIRKEKIALFPRPRP